MAKNKKIDPAAKEAEAFMQNMEKFGKFLESKGSMFFKLFVAFVVLGLVWVGFSSMNDKKLDKAAASLFPVTKAHQKIIDAERQTNYFQQLTEPKKEVDAAEWETKYKDIIAGYNKVASTSKGMPAAYASLNLASIYSQGGKIAEAKKSLEDTLKANSKSQLLKGLAQYQLAVTEMDAGNYDTAISSFDKVLSSKKLSYLFPQALENKGLALVKLDKKEDAKKVFDKLLKDHPKTASADTANSFTNWYEFSQ